MIVRRAAHADLDRLIEMGRQMHRESGYSFLPFDEHKVRRMMQQSIDDPVTRCSLVAEQSAELAGMLGGYLTDYTFCDERLACDLLLFVDPRFRGSSAAARLIRGFCEWAAERGAREVVLGISGNQQPEIVGRFYRTLGFSHAGGVYKIRLENRSPV